MKILGIIPARSGSKGVKEKNIKHLNRIPLIHYTISVAHKSNLDRVVVSTDSESIAEIAREAQADVPFLRPRELAIDTASSIDVAIHALKEVERLDGIEYSAIMLLQPTTPFRNFNDINQAISLLEETGSDSVISVVDVEGNHPARMKYMNGNRLIDPPFCEEKENQNRQELQPMYIRNGAIYLTKKETLLKKSFKGSDSRGLIMPQNRSVNIDTISDFNYAEWILLKNE